MKCTKSNFEGSIFDRETKREKNLEKLRQTKKPGGDADAAGGGADGNADDARELVIDERAYVDREQKFFNDVGLEGEALGTAGYLNKKGGGE